MEKLWGRHGKDELKNLSPISYKILPWYFFYI